ncbi:hypothetical protein BJ742DRAFT_775477 [Cladochytrium replicatum]|nr:hypothetical protein BJ742DRAFT_775477 [Cladochytrium replicatum]
MGPSLGSVPVPGFINTKSTLSPESLSPRFIFTPEASAVESSIRTENDTIARRNLSLERELEALKCTLREQQNLLKFQRDLFDHQLREQQQELMRNMQPISFVGRQ